MCGIVGTLSFRGSVDRDLLLRQRDTMLHRGPDSDGLWISDDGRIGFGHRRLAIVDLSPGGHQPMIDGLTGAVITFNGEIYNYLELKSELSSKGHHFHTKSDTEVILVAFREWGPACLERLHGMFALALYDPRSQQVLLARDRAGEKPLFYRVTDSQLSFASEAKALLADPSCPRRVRRQSLNEYFAYGYVTGSHTMFADISRVLPGERVIVDLRDGTRRHELYWQLPTLQPKAESQSDSSIGDEVESLLRQAVRRQLAADVPVGVMLSGGVDSSLIAAIAAQVSGSRIRTFTARFPGHGSVDEGPFARMVAEHIGAEHIELETPPADADLLQALVAQYDDPISDSSMIPTYLVSREIRRHATVALGGDGGDELFGGYHRYPSQLRQQALRRQVPAFARRGMSQLGAMLIPEGARGRGLLEALAGDVGTSISNAGRLYRSDERRALSPHLQDLQAAELMAPEAIRASSMHRRTSPLQRGTAVDFTSYMVDDVLVKVDRASMLTSLEVRAPFLDIPVIEYAFGSVPDRLKATRDDRKIVLRRIGAKLLPEQLDLTRKQGFSIPVESWMRGAWQPLLESAASGSSAGLIAPEAFLSLQRLLTEGRAVGDRLYSLLFLRLWEQHYGISDVV
ncbi:MAG TPA: asparagine synthase (glutamine-hydrolyzing) [Gemmatimonas aurantiaca]|uniref:asparagine synthase (glutamine-hydrolyzing) n=2 Tax=Gemmatimonas aurantiaca TaxID=173480 RepID=C1A5T9_GEMAT|nr:asparagine synthase (glutamine-hydrolyzing) [Gemmatimonas aurantiaca]BAH37599.1 asparagine synthetase [Gemmatimonas aurantiaca T-27]HCT58633.1 asparagine synthase (glutamine-hydrolyzing) [Gemmatimonas aurantiaca]